jgi:type II secretory pathway component PulM
MKDIASFARQEASRRKSRFFVALFVMTISTAGCFCVALVSLSLSLPALSLLETYLMFAMGLFMLVYLVLTIFWKPCRELLHSRGVPLSDLRQIAASSNVTERMKQQICRAYIATGRVSAEDLQRIADGKPDLLNLSAMTRKMQARTETLRQIGFAPLLPTLLNPLPLGDRGNGL